MLSKLLALTASILLSCTILAQASGSVPLAEGEGFITAPDGVRLFYKVVGKGPESLIVLHGGPGNTMFSILPDLEPLTKDHRVIYYDQRGNGLSELVDDEEQLAISKHIEDLEAVRRHFNLEKVTLLGNSWGGLLASLYAIANPDRVERLVLHSPASPSFNMLRESTPFIYQRIPPENLSRFQSMSVPAVWRSARDPLALCRRFYDLLLPVYFSDVDRAAKMRGDVCYGPQEAVRRQPTVNKIIWESLGEWDLLSDLESLNIPTLVIHGSYDMIPIDSSIAWAKALPDARLLVIEDSGHMTHIEQPDIFFPAVLKFLSRNWPENSIQIPKNKDVAKPRIDTFRP